MNPHPHTDPGPKIRKSFLPTPLPKPNSNTSSLFSRQAILGRRKTSTKVATRRRTFDSASTSSSSSSSTSTYAPEINSVKERTSSVEAGRVSSSSTGSGNRQSFNDNNSFQNLQIATSSSNSSSSEVKQNGKSPQHNRRPSFVSDALRKLSGVSHKLFSTHHETAAPKAAALPLPVPLPASSPQKHYLEQVINKSSPPPKTAAAAVVSISATQPLTILTTPEQQKKKKTKMKTVVVEYNSFSMTGAYHENEDTCFSTLDISKSASASKETLIKQSESFTSLFGVFDGHGGDACSKWCSENLEKIFKKSIYRHNSTSDLLSSMKMALTEATLTAECDFCRMATQIRDDSGACSLLVALRSHSFAVASAGDCQGVLVYENGTRYKELTTPHRAGDRLEKQRIYAAGGFVKRGRVMGVLEPSRTIGDLDVKRMCDKAVISEPFVDGFDYGELLTKIGEVIIPAYIVLASDGVFDVMDAKSIAKCVTRVLRREKRSKRSAEILCREAKKSGSDDDITAICIMLE